MTAPVCSLWVFLLLSLVGAWSGSAADDLPPGVPNPIGPDGKYTPALAFTTKAYSHEAFRLVLQEANRVAGELGLPEKLPITEGDLVTRYLSPFGCAYVQKAIGNVTTRNYTYYVSQGNRFSYLEGTRQAADCRRYQRLYTWPLSRMDTNQAYQLAIHWLGAAGMDVAALSRDCSVVVQPEKDYVHPPQDKFVPVYYVYWRKRDAQARRVPNVPASVRLFTPDKTLLQLRVEDPKYILRPPLVFTNLQFLLSQTNEPATPHY
jgi:hypothetical protein